MHAAGRRAPAAGRGTATRRTPACAAGVNEAIPVTEIRHEATNEVLCTLPGRYLSGADLRDARLSGADLKEADLHDASLECADRSEAALDSANLNNVDLERADLRAAHCFGATLQGTNPRRVNLRMAVLRHANPCPPTPPPAEATSPLPPNDHPHRGARLHPHGRRGGGPAGPRRRRGGRLRGAACRPRPRAGGGRTEETWAEEREARWDRAVETFVERWAVGRA
jgi:hypothetical protein